MVLGVAAVYVSPMMLVFAPGGAAYLLDMLLEKVFLKYMTKERLKAEQELDWADRDF